MVNSVTNIRSCENRKSDATLDIKHLTECHFIRKIPTTGQKSRIARACKVCNSAHKEVDKKAGIKRRRAGHESSYECGQCLVSLCVHPCFELYRYHKDYISSHLQNIHHKIVKDNIGSMYSHKAVLLI